MVKTFDFFDVYERLLIIYLVVLYSYINLILIPMYSFSSN